MARKLALAAAAAGLWALSGAAWASGDGGCYASWKLFEPARTCFSRAVIAPGNDTRVNLLFLLRGSMEQGAETYPKQGWNSEGFGQTFFDWNQMRAAFYPSSNAAPADDRPSYYGSRCASLTAGGAAFVAAMAAARRLPAAERASLVAARARLEKVCANGEEARYAVYRRNAGGEVAAVPPLPDWPANIASAPGKAFLGYLQASDAFYGERWEEARGAFGGLVKAPDPWVAETASYMLARIELNAAMANAFDQYGSFDGIEKVDQQAVGRAAAGLAAYLKAWPNGRYAASAEGLKRRVLWLSGNGEAMAAEYVRLLGAVPASGESAAQLVEEIDNRLLFPFGEDSTAAARGPLLLAIADLAQMRYDPPAEGYEGSSAKLTAAALNAQQAAFAGQPELYGFLQASHAFHVAKDYRRVLQLIPDDARRSAYAPLSFSRQMLRGMALAQLGDRNEAGFWLELLGGAGGLWQRPTAELALAMNYERSGKLAAVFSKGSPISDSDIRMILLSNSAGPDILRAEALDRSRPLSERTVALHTLLSKALSYGDYARFLTNAAIRLPALGADGAERASAAAQQLPAFVSGKWAEDYACPALADTARKLSANPQDSSARLCLGEFWRLNDFDPVDWGEGRPEKDELGGAVDDYPGKAMTRASLYDAVIADPRAPAADKAYALYRAINCYGPSGYNGCGGADATKPQRRAWFQRLKRDYAASPWSRKQSIYW